MTDPFDASRFAYEAGFGSGERDMLAKCIAAVETYAEERLTVTKNPKMSEDITAALRVAVKRLRALQEKP